VPTQSEVRQARCVRVTLAVSVSLRPAPQRRAMQIWENWIVLESSDYDIVRTLGKIDQMPVSVEVRESLKTVLLRVGANSKPGRITYDLIVQVSLN
jgi:hypothetical protein